MTRLKTTKRTLIGSMIALFVCFTMLLGTTFAWFTDSVKSSGNVIKTGKLDVAMYWMEGDEDPSTATWFDASEGAIFNNDKWEPGYVEAKHIKIANEGTLAFKYKLSIVPNGEVEELADVIDVYYVEGATQVTRGTLPQTAALVGTLRDMIENAEGAAHGALLPVGATETDDYERVGEVTATIVFKMRETAGDEFQNKQIGTDFAIQLLATQYAYESDSFDNRYDSEAKYVTPVSTLDAFFTAIEQGDDILLEDTISIDGSFIDYVNARYPVSAFALGDGAETIDYDAVIDGGGVTVYRTEETKDAALFSIAEGYSLTLSDITLDGGAKWTGAEDPVLLRGTTNEGLTTSANIVSAAAGAHIVLEEGAVIQNNEGAFAVSLTRNANGSSLTLNGGEIINNHSGGGAIWGGGKITVNNGKINGNSSSGIAGAIRMLNNNAGNTISFTMNGGEINRNKAASSGGAIWGGGNASFSYNGGEIAYNYAGTTGGAIFSYYNDKQYFSGDFELHHNTAAVSGSAVYFESGNTHPIFEMTGGKIYENGTEDDCDVRIWNVYANLYGGEFDGSIEYAGGLFLTVGNAAVSKVKFDSSRGDYKILLAEEFGTLEFVVNESHALFSEFMLDPADGYVYTEGDEKKLVCLNEGYEVYWDADTETFRLRVAE